MTETAQKTPIKLKSLREQRELFRSNSNHSQLLLSPIFEFPKLSTDNNLNQQNRNRAMPKFRKFDSPKSIYEGYADTSLKLIEKANAAMEVLEVHKEKNKQNSLLFKRDKNEKNMKSGLVYRPMYRTGNSGSPDIESGFRNDKKYIDLDFMEENKQKKLTKEEAKKLISRLQGHDQYCRKH